MRSKRGWIGMAFCLAMAGAEGRARATVFAVDQSYFAGDPTVDLTGITPGTSAYGLSLDGVTFTSVLYRGIPPVAYGYGAYLVVGYIPVIPPFPPDTPPSIAGESNYFFYTVYLRMKLDSQTTAVGFNYGISGSLYPMSGMGINLFDNTRLVGTTSVLPTVSDGWWGVGYAGILSTVPFDRVEINFAPYAQYFFNTISYAPSPVPEPGTLALVGAGVAGLLGRRRLLSDR